MPENSSDTFFNISTSSNSSSNDQPIRFDFLCFHGSFLIIVSFSYLYPGSNNFFFKNFSYIAYAVSLLLMVYTLFFGQEINGAKSWLRFGGFGLQSSEFMKITTILAAANFLTSRRNIATEQIRYALVSFLIIFVPTLLVIAQNDFGTAIIFLALIPVILFCYRQAKFTLSMSILPPKINLDAPRWDHPLHNSDLSDIQVYTNYF